MNQKEISDILGSETSRGPSSPHGQIAAPGVVQAAMKTKDVVPHTPGPWKIRFGGQSTDDGFAIASDNVTAERVKVVAECWPCSIVDQLHRDELLANARLIAESPELLEMLCTIVANAVLISDPMMSGATDCYAIPLDDIEQARAAIARATGGGEQS